MFAVDDTHPVHRRDVLIPTPTYRFGYPYGYVHQPYGYLRSYGYPYYYGTYL